ncbi:MAG TPA: MurR/RpiR family transcriptional regulator [Acidobacteriaceae bacterium]|jgi:DNA-binding MurR/RpiR family transcriptional regulator|nr:MurR/RpiR family transcriptional regulator [Acidobacteriaceae bacterium]
MHQFKLKGQSMPKRALRPKKQEDGVGTMLNRVYRTRQEMMRPILEHPREYVLLSIRALAEKLQVDPATISRTVIAMGFPNYREFRKYLHQRSVTHSTAFERMHATNSSHTSFEGHVRKTLDGAIRNLEGACNHLDINHLKSIADRFYAAKRIFILGGDLAASLVHFLHYQLMELGFDVTAATSGGHVTHLMQRVTRKDLVIAISFRRGLRQTVEGLIQARAKGCYTIGITDTSISPIARSADECLFVFVDAPDASHFGASYVAPMAVLDAIISAITNRRRARSMAILKQMEEDEKTGYRWYPEI